MGENSWFIAYRFGGFELNVKAAELRSAAGPIRLPNQALQILLLLLEHHGEVVSREDIRKRVWPEDVTVGFDHAIAKGINRLREVLHDSPASPRFIETRSRLGYRFIAEVATVSEAPGHAGPEEQTLPSVPPRHPIPAASKWVTVALASLLFTAILTLFAGFHILPDRSAAAATRCSVLVMKVENRTGNVQFEGALNYALETEIATSPFVDVVSPKRANEQLQYMRKPAGAISDLGTAREVCLRDGDIQAIVEPRIERVGSTYLLRSEVVSCATGTTRFVAKSEARNESAVLAAVDSMATQVRESLGRPMPSAGQKLKSVTTSSLAALKLFTDARQHLATENAQDIDTAINLLQQAVAIDPEFAMAWSQLAAAITWRCEWGIPPAAWKPEDAGPYYEKSLRLAAQTSDREKYLIVGRYHRDWSMDVKQEVSAFETLHSLSPDDVEAMDDLASAYMRDGRGDDAERLWFQVADRRKNDFEATWDAWRMICALQRSRDAERLRVRALSLVSPEVRQQHAFEIVQMETQPIIDLLNAGQVDEALQAQSRREKEFESATGEERENLAAYIAKIYFDLGQLRIAEEWQRRSGVETLFERVSFAAVRTDRNRFRTAVLAAFKSQRLGANDFYHAIDLGMRAQAESNLPRLRYDRRIPSQAVVRAELDRTAGHTDQALEEFRAVQPLVHTTANWFEPVILDRIARTQEQLGDIPGAIATLEVTVTEPMVVLEVFTDCRAQARLHLARLYRQTGRTANAEKIEAELRNLYRHADPEFLAARQVEELEHGQKLASRALPR